MAYTASLDSTEMESLAQRLASLSTELWNSKHPRKGSIEALGNSDLVDAGRDASGFAKIRSSEVSEWFAAASAAVRGTADEFESTDYEAKQQLLGSVQEMFGRADRED